MCYRVPGVEIRVWTAKSWSGRQNPCPGYKNPGLGKKIRMLAAKSVSGQKTVYRRQNLNPGDQICVCAGRAVCGQQDPYLGYKIHVRATKSGVWSKKFISERQKQCLGIKMCVWATQSMPGQQNPCLGIKISVRATKSGSEQ